MSFLSELDDDELEVYRLMYQQVEQYRRLRGDHAMKDLEELRKAGARFREELRREVIAELTPEQRLAGLTPEQRLAGLPPEQRLAGLPPEQRLAGLPPEQRLAGLPPEQRLAGLPPEQRLAGLTPEQIAELVARLPPEVTEAVKKQMS